jgi:hypothetical protein
MHTSSDKLVTGRRTVFAQPTTVRATSTVGSASSSVHTRTFLRLLCEGKRVVCGWKIERQAGRQTNVASPLLVRVSYMDQHRAPRRAHLLLPVRERRIYCEAACPRDRGLTRWGSVAMVVTDVSVLGRLSTDYLAAASLANVWMNVT